MSIMLERGNIQKDLVVSKKVAMLGCMYDLAGNRYAFIQPEDSLVITDVDGFLLDSQKLIDEEVGRIDEKSSPSRRDKLEALKNVITARLEEKEEQYKIIAIEEKYDKEAIKQMMEEDYAYQKAWLELEKVNDELRDFKRRRNIILEEKDPSLRRIDYEGIFANCPVDEEACKLIADNIGSGKLFSKGLAETWYNRNPIESIAKCKRLRPYLENIPILSVPWPEEKVFLLETIHGSFCFPTSLILDDQSVVESDTNSRYPDMQVEIKRYDETTCETIERGFQKIRRIKETM